MRDFAKNVLARGVLARRVTQVSLALAMAALAACTAGPNLTPPEVRALLDAGRLEEGAARLEAELAKAPNNVEARLLLINTRRALASRALADAAQAARREAWDEA
ncbi:MAG: hypothetical protein ACLGI6_11080 [Gammaproteobacteria bacterium]